jgi:hypothetical protein
MSVDELSRQLHAAGHDTSHGVVTSIRSNFRDTLRLLKEAGHLKGLDL